MSESTKSQRSWGFEWADGLLLLTATIWGVNFSVVKFALADIPPKVFMGLRFVIASSTMLILASLLGRSLRFERRHLPALVGLGLLGNSVYQVLFVYGISWTTAANTSLILATGPAWVALAGTILGVEKVDPPGWLGIGLSLTGIILIISGSDRFADFPFGGWSLKGDLLILAGTLCWAFYTLLIRPMTQRYSSISVTSFTTAVGTIPLMAVAVPASAQLGWREVGLSAWSALVFSGVFAIALAYFFWNHGISKLGSARTSIYSNLSVPVALLTASVWLRERLTPQQWAGTLLAITGIILARRFTHHRRLLKSNH